MHTDQKIDVDYANKGYAGAPNRNFLAMNQIADGIMRKNNINACLTEAEIARNKSISKKRYIETFAQPPSPAVRATWGGRIFYFYLA